MFTPVAHAPMLNALIAIRARRPIPHSKEPAPSRGGAAALVDPAHPVVRATGRARRFVDRDPRPEEAPADATLLGGKGAHVRVLAHHRQALERNARRREPGAAQELAVGRNPSRRAPRRHLGATAAFLQCIRFTDGAQCPPEGTRIQQHAILKVFVTTEAQLAPRQRQSHAMTSTFKRSRDGGRGEHRCGQRACRQNSTPAVRRCEAVAAGHQRPRREQAGRGRKPWGASAQRTWARLTTVCAPSGTCRAS